MKTQNSDEFYKFLKIISSGACGLLSAALLPETYNPSGPCSLSPMERLSAETHSVPVMPLETRTRSQMLLWFSGPGHAIVALCRDRRSGLKGSGEKSSKL